MTILIENGAIRLEGVCGHDEVEELLDALEKYADLPINLTQTEHLHTAILQVLVQAKRQLDGEARDAFIRDWLVPVLQ